MELKHLHFHIYSNIDVGGGWSQGAKNNFCSPKKGKVSTESMKNEEWSLMLMSFLNSVCFTL